MQPSKSLVISILIIAAIALLLSFYNSVVFGRQIAEIENTLEKSEKALAEFGELAPKFETLDEFLPRIEQFLLNIPPVPTD